LQRVIAGYEGYSEGNFRLDEDEDEDEDEDQEETKMKM